MQCVNIKCNVFLVLATKKLSMELRPELCPCCQVVHPESVAWSCVDLLTGWVE